MGAKRFFITPNELRYSASGTCVEAIPSGRRTGHWSSSSSTRISMTASQGGCTSTSSRIRKSGPSWLTERRCPLTKRLISTSAECASSCLIDSMGRRSHTRERIRRSLFSDNLQATRLRGSRYHIRRQKQTPTRQKRSQIAQGLAYIGSLFLWLAALRRLPLHFAYGLASSVHLLVPLASWLVLHETIPYGRLLGMLFILAGIVLLGAHRHVSSSTVVPLIDEGIWNKTAEQALLSYLKTKGSVPSTLASRLPPHSSPVTPTGTSKEK
jgi:multidrug transporter EmrE-like cation transporter